MSPGLINTHDHITFTQNSPYNDTGERYEDRHQWRKGGVNIPGGTASTYDIAIASQADAGTYDVVVTGACGSQTSNSAAVVE